MKNIKYVIVIAVSLSIAMFAGNAGIALAQTSGTTQALLNQIQLLLQQVKTLQDQMTALNAQMKQTLQLTRSLSFGMTSDEVKLLQEILAADRDIYPEGLITGYYGHLTERAVKKFQKKHGFEQLGIVGPKTRKALQAFWSSLSTSTVSLPPGLAKKSGSNAVASTTFTLEVNEFKVILCHKPDKKSSGNTITVALPALLAHLNHGDLIGSCPGTTPLSTPTTTPDVIAPVISNLTATSTASTTASISWTTNENATSTLWYSAATPVNTDTAARIENNDWKTSHLDGFTGLTATTTYYYVVKVADAAGNSATSTEHSFTTLEN